MRRTGLALLLACAAASVFAASAVAVESYGGPRYWYPGESAGSSYRSSWYENAFHKPSGGYETTVTFIDNVSYAWHRTIRNRDQVTRTSWWVPQVKRGHCRAHTGYHWGGCHVY